MMPWRGQPQLQPQQNFMAMMVPVIVGNAQDVVLYKQAGGRARSSQKWLPFMRAPVPAFSSDDAQVNNKFEALPQGLEPTSEDADLHPDELKARIMRFISNLFLRQSLTTKIVSNIIQELMMVESLDQVPEEHVVECVCELLRNVGSTLEFTPVGKNAVVGVTGRMKELKGRKDKNGKAVLCKRIQFSIQNALDARAAGWEMKSFKKSAKTKEEARLEQESALKAKGFGKDVSAAEFTVVGQRPSYIQSK